MHFPVLFASRRGAIAGTLMAGLALGLSTFGVVRAERVNPDIAKTFNCNSGTVACVNGINSRGGGYGVTGKSPAGAGVFGEVTSPNFSSYVSSGVQGDDFTGLVSDNGVSGYSSAGNGVFGESAGYSAIVAQSDSSNASLFVSTGTFTGGGFADIDGYGNVVVTGLIYTAGSCKNGCARTKDADHRVVSYTPRESVPSMEDTGEARLVNGYTYVRIDSALANVIDRGAEFSVFITPEGDSRGLYVTQKSSAGFAVHENQGGRSTLPFAYRIVAKPYADASPRLPMHAYPMPTGPSAHRDQSPMHLAR